MPELDFNRVADRKKKSKRSQLYIYIKKKEGTECCCIHQTEAMKIEVNSKLVLGFKSQRRTRKLLFAAAGLEESFD